MKRIITLVCTLAHICIFATVEVRERPNVISVKIRISPKLSKKDPPLSAKDLSCTGFYSVSCLLMIGISFLRAERISARH